MVPSCRLTLAAASYGGLARFRNVQRLHAIGTRTLLSTSGDISDMQATLQHLQALHLAEHVRSDGHALTPRQWHTTLATRMYEHRTKMDPLWNAHAVAGIEPHTGEHFLAYVDLLGTTYEASSVATGFGAYLAQPLLRAAVEGKEGLLSEAEASTLLEKCMLVLWYRHGRASDLVQMAKVTGEGVVVSAPYKLSSDWSVAESV